ncbi:MAG: type II toxin-antitoxin system RelE/ParE family toxin [Pirellulaceae bacterium]|jgi:plasmid stabilization system protein ParE|nr:type II toxin-antitoxin system RelE/ParE family toxin [Pirellulaceae bacterium]
MKVRWTEKASKDALAIHAYIAEQSEVYADAVYARLVARPETQLVANPLSGSIVPEYGRRDLREVYVHSFRVIYLVLNEEVRVLAVVHGAHLLPPDPPMAG